MTAQQPQRRRRHQESEYTRAYQEFINKLTPEQQVKLLRKAKPKN